MSKVFYECPRIRNMYMMFYLQNVWLYQKMHANSTLVSRFEVALCKFSSLLWMFLLYNLLHCLYLFLVRLSLNLSILETIQTQLDVSNKGPSWKSVESSATQVIPDKEPLLETWSYFYIAVKIGGERSYVFVCFRKQSMDTAGDVSSRIHLFFWFSFQKCFLKIFCCGNKASKRHK